MASFEDKVLADLKSLYEEMLNTHAEMKSVVTILLMLLIELRMNGSQSIVEDALDLAMEIGTSEAMTSSKPENMLALRAIEKKREIVLRQKTSPKDTVR